MKDSVMYYEVNIWTNARGTIESATFETEEEAYRQYSNWKYDVQEHKSRYPYDVKVSEYEWTGEDEYNELERFEIDE